MLPNRKLEFTDFGIALGSIDALISRVIDEDLYQSRLIEKDAIED